MCDVLSASSLIISIAIVLTLYLLWLLEGGVYQEYNRKFIVWFSIFDRVDTSEGTY